MSLLDRQIAFRDEIAAGDDAAPYSSLGMAIYRDAYRGRLLAALETSFERTRRWVGNEAFTTAACHYILTSPPTGWSLDDYGADFPQVLESLFARDAEVADLAWLEWHLQRAFAASDGPELDPASLARAGYSEADWANMRFTMAAGFAARRVATNGFDLWAALAGGEAAGFTVQAASDAALLVWRSGLSPRHRQTTTEELGALEKIADGVPLGVLADTCDAAALGTWLTQWLAEGIFAQATPSCEGIAPD